MTQTDIIIVSVVVVVVFVVLFLLFCFCCCCCCLGDSMDHFYLCSKKNTPWIFFGNINKPQKVFIFFESKFGKKLRSRRVDFIEKLALENEEAEESNIKATNKD